MFYSVVLKKKVIFGFPDVEHFLMSGTGWVTQKP